MTLLSEIDILDIEYKANSANLNGHVSIATREVIALIDTLRHTQAKLADVHSELSKHIQSEKAE